MAIDTGWFIDELLFGGARGGGKTDFLLADFMMDIERGYGSGWCGLLLRKTYPECEEIIARSRQMFPACFPNAKFNAQSKTWHFRDGATLRIRALDQPADADKFQGHAYSWIGFDELGQWATPEPYHKLKATLRSARPVRGKRIRATANPGGRGHHWLKRYFGIDRYPHGGVMMQDADSKFSRMFIKSRLSDNHILLKNDPDYAVRLRLAGDQALVKAWLEGNWDIIAGSYFTEWDAAKHVLPPLTPPQHWLRFVALDWGSSSPFSVGWWAVASEELRLESGAVLPRGALLRYREWYGCDAQGHGLKLSAETLADGIIARSGGEKMIYAVADPSIFRCDGGPSLAERMARRGIKFQPADNNRLAGWDQLRARLRGVDDVPLIYCTEQCIDSIRSIPALLHDPQRPEDLDSGAEDHAADEWRYACMSRPYIKSKPIDPHINFIKPPTWNDLHAMTNPVANPITRI